MATSMSSRHLLLPFLLGILVLSEAGQPDHTGKEDQPRPFGRGYRCTSENSALRTCPFTSEHPGLGLEEQRSFVPDRVLLEEDESAVLEPQLPGNVNEQDPISGEPESPWDEDMPRPEHPGEDDMLGVAEPEHEYEAWHMTADYPIDPAPIIARVWRRQLSLQKDKEDEPATEIPEEDDELSPIGSSEDSGNKTLSKHIAVSQVDENSQKLETDAHNLQVVLNLEFLEAEFFLNSVYGKSLDDIEPELANGGPLPSGAKKAKLDKLARNITTQFALQEIGHLRAIKETLGKYYFSRPHLNISKQVFAEFIDKAFGAKLNPPFNVYANSINYFIGVYIIPYIALTGYVGASMTVQTLACRRQIIGLLAVEAGQDAVIRGYLFGHLHKKVTPYNFTVGEFTERISNLRNHYSEDGDLDEGLTVPEHLGAEGRAAGNIISADHNSLAYGRSPAQVFSTVYGTGVASKPGGFFPRGARGKIAEDFLEQNHS